MSAESDRPVLHVVAAAILDATGRVLIAQRPHGKHLAYGWEFPGGKIERGETPVEALARELLEEVGITLLAAHPLIRLRHAYKERDVDLDVWKVTAYEGLPGGLEGQPVRWCASEDLPTAGLVSANQPVVNALVLPETITSVNGGNFSVGGSAAEGLLIGSMCASKVQAAAQVACGANFILATVVLDPPAIEAFTAALNVPVYVRDVELEVAWEFGASGLHTLMDS